MLRPEEFSGLWTRSLLAWPDGTRDISTRVSWLQGLGLFADLRQKPELSAGLSTASCRDALTAQDCATLATQQAFSGRFEPRGDAYQWVRRIDYQPRQPQRDIGRLSFQAQMLVEHGVEADYTEHWHRDGESVPASAGIWLHDPARNVSGCVLRVGGWFAYARGRDVELAGDALTSLVENAGSLQDMQRLIDCEISFGQTAGGWRISRSTLPYRLGAQCAARRVAGDLRLLDMDQAGQKMERIWNITEQEGDISIILDTMPQNF